MLEEIDERVDAGHSFAFETTLSGLTYLKKIPLWQEPRATKLSFGFCHCPVKTSQYQKSPAVFCKVVTTFLYK